MTVGVCALLMVLLEIFLFHSDLVEQERLFYNGCI